MNRIASHSSGTGPVVLVDARCLQDPNYALRGVGRLASGLFRDRPPAAAKLRLVALIDPALPPLQPSFAALFQATYLNPYAAIVNEPCLRAFVQPSPMTHDPIFIARVLADHTLLHVAVVHDFIPMRESGRYLPGAADRLDYAVQLRWLKTYDLFCSNSQSTADDLVALLNVPSSAVHVVGASVDPIFQAVNDSAHVERPDILVAGGGDPRKNPNAVLRAHGRSERLQAERIALVITGSYGQADINHFHALAAGEGGDPALVQMPGQISDGELLRLFGRARVVVSASRDEGFSIPLIEGMAAGAAVLASDIPAHAELVPDPAWRFDPTDYIRLTGLLEQAFFDAPFRDRMLVDHAAIWPRFVSTEVSARFWSPILDRLPQLAPAILTGRKPKVALLSPLPPAPSGVADYTAASIPDLGERVELHVFTETQNPTPIHGAASIRPLDELAHTMPGFDRVIGVLGNSDFHVRIFEQLGRHGGACIAHDARMLSFYRHTYGVARTLRQASHELGRDVTLNELDIWFASEAALPTLFLGEIAAFSTPMIVHSHVTARLMRERHGIDPVLLPFCIYRPWKPHDLAPERRVAARARLGLPDGEIVIASFGYVNPDKGPFESLWALDFLRAWGIDASLHLVGGLNNLPERGDQLRVLARDLGLTQKVRLLGDFVSEETYRDYCLGADLAIQVRAYTLGGLSGALLDCAAAGLPCVTNISLADAVDVPPEYNRTVPDLLNPILIAEACRDLIESGVTRHRPETERAVFSRQRSFKVYARRLCEELGLETEVPGASESAS